MKLSIEDLVSRLRAVADERRLRLLRLCADGPASVSALAAACADSEPNVSRQLKQLATAGLVQRMRQGQYVEYALSTGEGSAAYMARWLLTQIDEGDAALQGARRALQQARDAEIARSIPGRGLLPPSRFGRTLAATLAAPAGSPAALRVALRIRHPEMLTALAAGAGEIVVLAASAVERAQWRRWAAEQSCAVQVELAATLLARAAQCWDLVVLEGMSARGGALAALEADFALARGLLAPQGRAWVSVDYDALESVVAAAGVPVSVPPAPPQRLRGLMLAAGLECQDLIPVESAGRHVLVARSAPLRVSAPLARSA
ncbi:MAG: helix-turn-helix transcriptional regulator [Sinobacteraceae bacterium]|nr:helix-turn-helix transcriptional regulator [Nevskiaceae bacterium]